MNGLSNRKAVLLVLAIFVVGLAGGAAIGFTYAKRSGFRPPQSRDMASHMRDRLRDDLKLSDEQLKNIDPILEETAAEMKEIHGSTMERISAIMKKKNDRIKEFLTPEQAAKMDEMEKERRERWGKFRGPHTNDARPH